MRMLMNNLDPDVAERPEDLVVYGGTGRAARSWEAFDAIVRSLRGLADDETLLVQSGKPVGVFRTHDMAPRVLISNAMLVPKWADWDTFRELEHAGLTMYGQMTAGSWIYIGTQGIVQGTYETFAEAARQHYGGSLAGRWILTAGLGGMGGAQPLAASFAGAVSLVVECQQSSIDFRLRTRYLDKQARDLDDALALVREHTQRREAVSIGLLGNAADVLPELAQALEDAIERRPVARRATDAAVHHQLLGPLGDIGVEVVLDHPVGGFGEPRAAVQGRSGGRAHHAARRAARAMRGRGRDAVHVVGIHGLSRKQSGLGHFRASMRERSPTVKRGGLAWNPHATRIRVFTYTGRIGVFP